MRTKFFLDPKDKSLGESQTDQSQENDDVVYLVNDDGTEFDDSERTYVSVDQPEDEEKPEK